MSMPFSNGRPQQSRDTVDDIVELEFAAAHGAKIELRGDGAGRLVCSRSGQRSGEGCAEALKIHLDGLEFESELLLSWIIAWHRQRSLIELGNPSQAGVMGHNEYLSLKALSASILVELP